MWGLCQAEFVTYITNVVFLGDQCEVLCILQSLSATDIGEFWWVIIGLERYTKNALFLENVGWENIPTEVKLLVCCGLLAKQSSPVRLLSTGFLLQINIC